MLVQSCFLETGKRFVTPWPEPNATTGSYKIDKTMYMDTRPRVIGDSDNTIHAQSIVLSRRGLHYWPSSGLPSTLVR